jgi:predicted DnaQ family exonuclease/DinG family helicase
MTALNSFVALDIETTGLDFKLNEIIEIGAVKYIENQKKDTFSCFIQIDKKLPLFIKQLTHITDEMLQTGISLNEALTSLHSFVEDLPVICHNSSFDMGFINTKLSHLHLPAIKNYQFDTVELARIYLPFIADHKLITVCHFFSISLANAHRAIYDAEATALVYQKLLELIQQMIPLKINYFLWELAKMAKLSTDLDFFLQNVVEQQKKFALLSKTKPFFSVSGNNYILHKPEQTETYTISQVFDKEGVFARKFKEYEIREGQIQMAEAVLHHFQQEEFLLVEAGTGVGKSFAYLIPALLLAEKSKEKVVISTNTKNLQEQLFNKDIPFVKECLSIPFSAVLLKGRRNYLCEKKWLERTMDFAKLFSPTDAKAFMNLVVWKEYTKTGDIAENSSFNEKTFASVWKELAADRHFCRGKKCGHFQQCYLMDIRKKTESSSLVIINHHLLLADLKKEKSTLGNVKYLIIDEAHNLPELVPNEMGLSFGYTDFSTFFSYLYNKKGRYQSGSLVKLKTDMTKSAIQTSTKESFLLKIEESFSKIDEMKTLLKDFFQKINQLVKEKGSYGKFRIRNFDDFPFFMQTISNIIEMWSGFSDLIVSFQQQLKALSANIVMDYDVNLDNLSQTIQRMEEFQEQLLSIYNPNLKDFSFWFSNFLTADEDFPAGVINYAPLHFQQILNDTLYQQFSSIVFTSATIAIRDKFTYFSQRMGLDWLDMDKVQELVVPSPFDFENQAQIIATTMLPAPQDKYFSQQSLALIKQVVELSKAGTMVLFTSYKDLNLAYDYLSEPFYQQDILLLAQGKGRSRSVLLNEFKSNRKSVLLGTSSFWEGVDIPGEALSLLILYKLPFLVPSEPIVEAYLESLEAERKNSFMHYMMPTALLKYRQGFGRLIRNKTDRGMVIVLDNRIKTKKYGHYFMEIVPAKTHFAESNTELIDFVGNWFSPFRKS